MTQAGSLRTQGLDQHPPAPRPATAAAGQLGDQRERSLLGPEVGEPQVGVGVLDDGQLHVRKVMPLSDHLGAHEDAGRRRGEAVQDGCDAALAASRVGIQPEHRQRRERLAQLDLQALRADAVARDRGRPAVRAGMRRALGVTAVVTDQPLHVAVAVQRQRHVAAAAHPGPPAVAAVDERRPSAPGHEHDRFLLALAHLLERAPRIRVQRVAQPAHVEQVHRRERSVVDALPEATAAACAASSRAAVSRSRRAAPHRPAGRGAPRRRARRSGDRSPACRRGRAPRRGPRGRGRRAARTPRIADRRRSAPRRCAAAATRRSARRGRVWSAGSRPGRRIAPRSASPSVG